jgi:hypothetical protein
VRAPSCDTPALRAAQQTQRSDHRRQYKSYGKVGQRRQEGGVIGHADKRGQIRSMLLTKFAKEVRLSTKTK